MLISPLAARREWALILLLTLLCLLLPTRNSTADAWYYAACVRYGHDLLLPHHLLHNVVGRLWLQLLTPLHPDALAAMQVLNALAYGGVLLGLRALLRGLGCPPARRLALLLLAGSSFGLLRFATENETYVLPLLASVLGSVAWLRYLATGRWPALLLAGAAAAGACLLHQVQVWWWLGLLIGTGRYGRRGSWLLFAAPALLVPVAYWLALDYWHLPPTPPALLRFVLHDFVSGSAGAPTSWPKAALLTVANLVRTFLQVHGTTLALLRRFPALLLVPALGLAGTVWAWLRHRVTTGARPAADSADVAAAAAAAVPRPAASAATTRAGVAVLDLPVLRRATIRTHSLILLLHLLFAAWASGNAEFMVMLPVLLALVAGAAPLHLPARPLGVAAGALLLWNLAFGLLPSHLLDYTNLPPLLAQVQQQPRTLFLLTDYNLALNRLHYLTGHDGLPRVLPDPAQLAQRHHWTPAQLRHWLRTRQQAGYRLRTDALGAPHLLDRARLTLQATDTTLLRGFTLVPVDSFPTFFGPRYLTELRNGETVK